MCKGFKQKKESKKPSTIGSVLNNLNPLSGLQKSSKKEKKEEKNKEEKDDDKLPDNAIILDKIKISDEIGTVSKYNKYLMEWYKN